MIAEFISSNSWILNITIIVCAAIVAFKIMFENL